MKLILHSRRLWSQNSRERRRSGGRRMCRPDQDRGVCQNDSQSDEKALCVNQILRIYVIRIFHRRHRRRAREARGGSRGAGGCVRRARRSAPAGRGRLRGRRAQCSPQRCDAHDLHRVVDGGAGDGASCLGPRARGDSDRPSRRARRPLGQTDVGTPVAGVRAALDGSTTGLSRPRGDASRRQARRRGRTRAA